MGSLEGRYGKRLARLEKLDKRARLRRVGQRWLEAVGTVSDRQLLITVLVSERFISEGRQDQLSDKAAILAELQGEERAGWAAYLESGADAAEIEAAELLKELPEDEEKRFIEDVLDDPRIRNRVSSMSKIGLTQRGSLLR